MSVGFQNCKPPLNLTSITRKSGDFLDFSLHPDCVVSIEQTSQNSWLTKDSAPALKEMENKIVLSMFKFQSR